MYDKKQKSTEQRQICGSYLNKFGGGGSVTPLLQFVALEGSLETSFKMPSSNIWFFVLKLGKSSYYII